MTRVLRMILIPKSSVLSRQKNDRTPEGAITIIVRSLESSQCVTP